VDLAEGVRMNTNLVGVSPADVHVGMAVSVDFEHSESGEAIAVFRPAGTPS
jgi:uncharacterized OB-fold protein